MPLTEGTVCLKESVSVTSVINGKIVLFTNGFMSFCKVLAGKGSSELGHPLRDK